MSRPSLLCSPVVLFQALHPSPLAHLIFSLLPRLLPLIEGSATPSSRHPPGLPHTNEKASQPLGLRLEKSPALVYSDPETVSHALLLPFPVSLGGRLAETWHCVFWEEIAPRAFSWRAAPGGNSQSQAPLGREVPSGRLLPPRRRSLIPAATGQRGGGTEPLVRVTSETRRLTRP